MPGLDVPSAFFALSDSRQEQLVLHHAVLDARRRRETSQVERLIGGRRQRLLAVDVLAALDCPPNVRRTQIGQCRVEVHAIALVRERLVEVCREARDPA